MFVVVVAIGWSVCRGPCLSVFVLVVTGRSAGGGIRVCLVVVVAIVVVVVGCNCRRFRLRRLVVVIVIVISPSSPSLHLPPCVLLKARQPKTR